MRNKWFLLITVASIGILIAVGLGLLILQEREQERVQERKDPVENFMNTYEQIVNSCWKENKQFPHINSRQYIQELANTIHAGSDQKSQGLVIGGPKDSGKTTGIIFMSKAAIQLGQDVLQLNLKGAVEVMQIKTLLNNFAHNLMNKIKGMNINGQKCVYDNISQCQGIDQSWGVVIDSIKAIITALGIGSVITAVTNTVEFIGWKWHLALLIMLLILVWGASEINSTVRYWIYFSGFSIQYRIGNSDWSTAFCCLNAIGHCNIRPILIIRDVKNFESQHLHQFFATVEKRKERENANSFALIIETSDNLWMNEAIMDTSNSAFNFYYLPPMTYQVGKEEMVNKYSMFNEETYDELYELFGGHVRFYEYFWNRRQLNDTIDRLMAEAEILLSACLMKLYEKEKQEEVANLFKLLQNYNFTLTRKTYLSGVVEHLIKCNLLFYNAQISTLVVQNRMLEKAINKRFPRDM